MFGRRKIATLVAEFLGTGVLTLVFLSVGPDLRATITVPYFIALAAGLVLVAMLYVFGDSSGAHLNPAITLALWTARKIGTLPGVLYIVAQLLGAWAAYAVYHYFVNTSLQPIGAHYSARTLVAEAVGVFVLALAWASAAYHRHTAGGRAAVIGAGYVLAILIAATAGIGIANPAVALGIRAWNIWGSMGWGTYVLGPVLGAIIGVNLYGLLFAPAEALVAGEAIIVSETEVAVPARSRAAATTAKPRRTTAKRKASTRKTTTRRTR